MNSSKLKKIYVSLTVLAVVALCGIAAPSAKADSYDFLLTNGTNTIDFQFPTTFAPDSSYSGGYFAINAMSFTVNGVAQAAQDIYFYSGAWGGGFDLGSALNQGGPQLYAGNESAPTFTLGTYNLTDWGGSTYGGNYTLTLTDPVTPVPSPEPSSLLMLGVGLFTMGGLIAYQQKKRDQAVATEAA